MIAPPILLNAQSNQLVAYAYRVSAYSPETPGALGAFGVEGTPGIAGVASDALSIMEQNGHSLGTLPMTGLIFLPQFGHSMLVSMAAGLKHIYFSSCILSATSYAVAALLLLAFLPTLLPNAG
ncbi:hypothetical protein [Gordonibacter sp. 28C]|uniref:hypothetical protein n=1 Tax=Gordonibacter sp. 28C TaxID=2078569 RepID=UPI001313FBC3|nr:hypothetical protein [Gordonibacter sp. 28C]